jgi:hypothetical protein
VGFTLIIFNFLEVLTPREYVFGYGVQLVIGGEDGKIGRGIIGFDMGCRLLRLLFSVRR